MEFIDFLRSCKKTNGEPLSENTIGHYDSGLRTISKDMLKEGIISKPLQSMNIFDLDIAISKIMLSNYFQIKDKTGNAMYSNALKRFRFFVLAKSSNNQIPESELEKINASPDLSVTEKEAIVKSRIGQGDYRARLLKKYNYKCIISNISVPSVLIASHIKPWAASSNTERLSSENGFILSATYDRLFDGGLISFQDNGKILISTMISPENIELLRLDKNKIYDIKASQEMKTFLDYHRSVIYLN